MRGVPRLLSILPILATLAIPAVAGAAASSAPPRASRRPTQREPLPHLENRTIAVFGLGQHYLEGGRGEPVIFLHGFGGASEGWRRTAASLASDFRVFVPDQIGFGASDKPPLDYSVATLADFLGEFMDEAGLEKATLVGHSMGARVACLFALAHPDRVEKLVLVSGAGYRPNMDPGVMRALDFNTLAEARRLLGLLYYDDAAHATEAAARQLFTERVRSGSGYTLSAILDSYRRGEGYADDLSPITAPTLLVWGRDDEITPSDTARRAQSQIAGAKVVLLDHCGHLPMVEAPDALLAALKGFLLDRPVPAAAR